MSDYVSVLKAAQQLPDDDRMRLIDALLDAAPTDIDTPLSDEWTREIERRMAELDAGTAITVPWSDIKNEALARIAIKH